MRLQAALLLLASCVPSALGIFVDEVNHIDFHHALLGVPSSQSTFFLQPSTSSQASLLYTLSEKSVLGAVNPRDGALVWRQNLSRSSLPGDDEARGLLRGSDGTNAMVGAVGDYISSWTAQDGKLIWENWFEDGSVADLELLELEDATATPSSRDTIALFGGKAGIVRRLDGESGDVKWEHKDGSGDVPFQVSASSTEIFYVSLQPALLKGYKIKVTSLDSVTGRQTQQQTLNSEGDVSGPDSVLFVGSNTAVPLIVWADKSMKTLKVNVIGLKQVSTLNIDNGSGEEIRSITVHAPKKLNSLPHFLVHYETDSSSWAEVYHVDLKSAAVSKAYDLPRLQEHSVFATSNKDANVYFTRITESETTVVSSASHGILGRWTLNAPSKERLLHAVSEVVPKGDSIAVRSAAASASGDWQLIRNGESDWTRPEALSGAIAASWAEVDYQEELVHQLEVEGHESILAAYVHRVKRHVRDLEHLPDWLRELPKRIFTSFLTDQVTNLDSFEIIKQVIVATENGRVFALDSGNHGSVSWSVKAAEAETWNVKAIVTKPGSATVYTDDEGSVTLNVTSGDIIKRTPPTDTKIRSVAVIDDEVTVGIKEDGTPAKPLDGPGFLVTTSADGRVLGWSGANNKAPVWEFLPPKGQKVIRATARPSHDPVASIGKVLGDRSVLYKYLSPNLALVTAVGDKSASFYLLDAISGQILHSSTQKGVDTSQPIASAISENWFAYSFWGESEAKGYQLVISELYESPIANDRGPLGSATNYSSIHGTEILPRPHVISQAFVIPEPISHMSVTQTRQGITTRQLICTLPASNAIIGIPRPVLDPRRPVGRDPTSTEAEEGLFKYSPVLDFDGRWYLTHGRSVAGIKNVLSSPTLLESTSLIFAYGGDIYATRVTPSQAFDVLGKGFSKLQLLMTIVALGVGVTILAPMVRRKQVNALWKA
ncbi:hypothetical protein ASPWEDRAFT_167712 [Aspergillus wentii DTO 134E9]|uniref:ER membrane protein complex subunit 1 n=1 Tax=Aspergillus wentii DTO 134E9 TaxID=1073089 RepID=A0A1L9S3F8_ASPWE|nr:uncharacterized protein ASPWEDRAFT_167712 [Aspergillus wentii DTO 134E9]KAI9930043.1 DUF1620 super [Aspergillus wentii]OJJ41705.1 hypothetical protein ASPWEDRAFT_167712 [Aspergillus wentii DTO 134E9]